MNFLNLKRRARVALITGLALVGVLFAVVVPSSPASATIGCSASSGSWHPQGSPAWGQVRWCTAYDVTDDTLYSQFQVQDILTDGWNVHLEIGANNGGTHWVADDKGFGMNTGTQTCQSSGSVTTCEGALAYFGSSYTPGSCGCYQLLIRVVKGSAGGSHPAYGATWFYFFV